MDILKEIKRVMTQEQIGIQKSVKFINPRFKIAVNLMFKTKGKIVVTGIGKSGIIAQKIASTLASTGTPAIYLHPSEGMHGNLGIVAKEDVVLAIGKSGESSEVLDILPSIRKIGSKIICLTSNLQSTLARKSDVVLFIPMQNEVCGFDLVPTTSSTVALVIGDALAVVLMKLRGFTQEHFALYHPGGILGKRLLLKISDVMRKGDRNPVVSIKASMETLLVEISKKWTGAASIVDSKNFFLGLVTDYDIRKALSKGKNVLNMSIQEIMNSKPTMIYEDEMAIKAAELMEFREKPLTVLPVLDRKKRAVGIIHTHDLILLGLAQHPSDSN